MILKKKTDRKEDLAKDRPWLELRGSLDSYEESSET